MHLDWQQLLGGGVASIILSAAARALPDPLPTGSRFYLFFYRFAHSLLANFDKASFDPSRPHMIIDPTAPGPTVPNPPQPPAISSTTAGQ